MSNKFLLRLSPLAVLVVSNFLLWLLLAGGGGSPESEQRSTVYHYFVMYAFYFSIFVAVFCFASAVLRSLFGDRVTVRLISFLLLLPSALLSLIAGLLSLSVAFNGLFLALIPAVLYFLALALFVWAEFFLGKVVAPQS
ncbi:hypothetical protein [Pseudomonas soli]|uniref:hypothetical protein n=1 Tax=Pseudomonas soli TaxID=1306993 RepID=UPI0011B54E3C|nr:hypothetical protein [Pseudomonas soli]